MSSSFNRRQVYNQIYFIFIILSCVSMPFKSNINSICLIVLLIVFLFKADLLSFLKSVIKSGIVASFSFFYLLHVLSYFNSINSSAAIKEIILKCPFLLIPIIIQGYTWSHKQVAVVLYSFIAVMLALSIYCFGETYYKLHAGFWFDLSILRATDWAYFSYILPQPIDFHAPYFALYNSVAILCLIFILSQGFKKYRKAKFTGLLLVGIYLFGFNVLLASRTSLLALSSALVIWVVYVMYQNNYIRYVGILIAFFTVFLLGTVTFVPYLRGKIESKSGVSVRNTIWKASTTIIKSNILFGVGTGDIKDNLRVEYKRLEFEEGIQNMYNAHNQYLQTTIALGVIGLIALSWCFTVLLQNGFKSKNVIHLLFTLIFLLCCFTESLLSRHHGVILFCFFASVLPLLSGKYISGKYIKDNTLYSI